MSEGLLERARQALYLDSCCYHAALATVLRWHGCGDPALVLGAGAGTNARATGDWIEFQDIYGGLSTLCRQRGHGCLRRPASQQGSWLSTLDRLDAGMPVIGLVDPFHLRYHWIDYQRTHSHHAVVLWAFDRDRGDALLGDPSEVLAFVDWLPLESIAPAWREEDRNQSWLDVDGSERPLPAAEALLGEVQALARDLVTDGELLSGAGLARLVAARFDVYLDLARRVGEPEARLGTDDRRRRNSHFLRGLWNFHHTLRWLARFVQAVSLQAGGGRLAESAAEIDRLAQSWLVVRNLLVKYGLSEPGRLPTLASFCAGRLARIAADTETAAGHLAAAVDELTGASGREALPA